ncbi:MAG: electron transport complex subunit RsxC [Clostridiales bacterium]|nr:electron transport complex subunit RsxC [Clostridiales bacterium]MDO5139866.1 electron transport complex subunit RsxC [Eubacteriales bacterium]
MGLATFKGGIHPYEGKELSEKCAIQLLPEFDGDYVFPMVQGLGAPSKPIVAVGDHVLAGQKIAEPGGFIGAVITSSVSGTVKAIEQRLITMGMYVQAIVIESDGKFETAEGVGEERDYTKLSKEEIRSIVKEAGIIGMGGAGFPTHVKLAPKNDDAIDFVIANGSECEPMLTNDHRLMIEEPERIIGGMKVCLQLFPNAKGIIAIEENKPEAIEVMQKLTADEDRISVTVMKTKYPEGGERQLIFACTGRSINSAVLPADAGCVVDNVATLAAIYDAVAKSTPIMQKVITISGDAVAQPANVRIRLGVSYGRIAEAVGGFKTEPAKIICGGPMMGMALFSTDVPVVKNSAALLAFQHDEVSEAQAVQTHCIRCGRCIDACPIFLTPVLMAKAVEARDWAKLESLNGQECIECGSCSYICPAKRPLTQYFKQGRREVMGLRRARQAAEAAKKAEAEKAAAEKKA